MRNRLAYAAMLALILCCLQMEARAADLAQLNPSAQATQNDLMSFVLDNLLAVIAGVVALIIVVILYLLRRRRGRTFRLKP
ncbi:MAG: hypothetical protein QOH93_2593 [Chloroflexia bacterium]|jgi:heme/copper-type cytochrome/quinol oxidase subunit 2|nr:hypothetical protein [Chloroflexia bacterium]